jgi:transposase
VSDDTSKKYDSHKALPRAKERIKIYEETVRRQSERIKELEKKNSRLEKENEKLKKELAAARKPPKWVKPKKDPKPKRAKKGPKPGHPANLRKRPEKADETVVLIPESCPEGHGELNFPSDSKWYSHFQIDLPEPGRAIVTEFVIGSSYCKGCRKYHSASNGRISHSLYGARFHATISYWKFELGLTLGKIRKLLKDQYNLDVSTGQLSEMLSRSAEKFSDSYDDLKTSLKEQSHLHADETGWRVDGDNSWLWSFSSNDVSVYTIEESRGQKVVEDVLGKLFEGVLTTDFYGAYNAIECAKQKCWAHLLRDLHELKKKFPKNLEIVYFSSRLKSFFTRAKKLREDHAEGRDIQSRLKRLQGDTERFAFRKFRHPKLKVLAKRIIKYRGELYTFIEKNLEPTNNNAEREIRPAVLMRKTSYGNRSERGAENQAILMTHLQTCRKLGLNFVGFATQHFARCH